VAYELRESSYTATNTSMLGTAYGRTKEFKDRCVMYMCMYSYATCTSKTHTGASCMQQHGSCHSTLAHIWCAAPARQCFCANHTALSEAAIAWPGIQALI
jgi:hypothetical protein